MEKMAKKKKKECPNGLTMGENWLVIFISGILTFGITVWALNFFGRFL